MTFCIYPARLHPTVDPVTEGHLLVIPYRHTSDWFTMTADERADSESLLAALRNQVIRDDPTVTGFNIGMNCGEVAGQTVMHAHIHLISRRVGDTPDPRGGVRGVIPSRMNYVVKDKGHCSSASTRPEPGQTLGAGYGEHHREFFSIC